MPHLWSHPDQNRTEKAPPHFRSPQKDFILRLALAAGLVLAQMPAGSLPAATVGADAVVLVNSSSAKYLDFKHSIQPYLDNFGVPYTVLDIASNAVGTNVGNYAVIIIGQFRTVTPPPA